MASVPTQLPVADCLSGCSLQDAGVRKKGCLSLVARGSASAQQVVPAVQCVVQG